MPQILEVIKEDAAATKKAMSDTDMKEKLGPQINGDVDAGRKVVADVTSDIKEKVEPEQTLLERITDPVKETMSDATEFVKNTFSSK